MDGTDVMQIYDPWSFIHSAEFTTDIVIEEVQEVYSTGPAETADGHLVQQDIGAEDFIQYFSYSHEDGIDESDVHETKFLLRFLATNTREMNRYLWVTDEGEVRTDGGYTNLATFFEVIHWASTSQDNYQFICQGGLCKGNILYMDGTSLKTRKYKHTTDDKDITTKFQMTTRGEDASVKGFISKTGVALYFDDEGNYRPEGPHVDETQDDFDTVSDTGTSLQPLYFITANVQTLRVTSV